MGYNINGMLQTVCLCFDPMMVDSFSSLLNCRMGRRVSDNDGPNLKHLEVAGV